MAAAARPAVLHRCRHPRRSAARCVIGDNIYGCVDMNIGPEDPRPFVELAATLGQDRIPWRMAVLIEGGGRASMQIKDIGASFLAMFPGNADLRRAFAFLREQRETENHISAKMRVSFATWAPVEEPAKLRRRMSFCHLSQRIEGWGNAKLFFFIIYLFVFIFITYLLLFMHFFFLLLITLLLLLMILHFFLILFFYYYYYYFLFFLVVLFVVIYYY